MKRNALLSAAVLFVLLVAVGLVAQQPDRKLTPTSFGTGPIGYKAVFDLLRESGVPVERNLARFADLPRQATVWWIEPVSLCGADEGPGSESTAQPEAAVPPERGVAPQLARAFGARRSAAHGNAEALPSAVLRTAMRRGAARSTGPRKASSELPGKAPARGGAGEWVERGGTAVVFLESGPESPPCAAVAGEALPPRGEVGEATETPGDEPAPTPAPALGRLLDRVDSSPRPVSGSLVPTPRSLTMQPIGVFTEAKGWNVVAAVEGKPFILERKVGDGRLLVVADAQFVSNGWLDHGDSAPLAMDLARVYGAPIIDERDHGFGASGGTAAFLWHSSARGAFLGLAFLGVLFAWWGAALPPRTASGGGVPSPTLESYVGSLATLYARARDYSAVADRYRDFTLSQLRRQTALPPDTPVEVVVDRLLRQRRLNPAEALLLRETPPVASPAELRQQTQLLDEILRKAVT